MQYVYLGVLLAMMIMIPYTFKWTLDKTKARNPGSVYIGNKFACVAFAIFGFGVGSTFLSAPFLAGELSLTLTLMYTLLLWGVSVAIATDLHVQLIPHSITFPLALTCLILRIIDTIVYGNMTLMEYTLNFLIAPAVLFAAYYILNKKTAGSAMGGGDVMLLTTIALAVGMLVLLVLFIFSLAATIFYFGHRVVKADKIYPLGPSIYVGLVTFYWVYISFLI